MSIESTNKYSVDADGILRIRQNVNGAWTIDGNTFFQSEKVPNRFHRLMQWLLFGIEWKVFDDGE